MKKKEFKQARGWEDEYVSLNKIAKESTDYSDMVDLVNKHIAEQGVIIPYAESTIEKLVYFTHQGSPEIGAELENGRKYNVGIPIFDRV